MRFCIVGAGFSGAVIARELAENGHKCLIVDSRNHIAGNCHTYTDSSCGIMVHAYGPHIFHTSYDHVWSYITKFCEMGDYTNRVKTTVGGRVYSMPINLLTINQFFGKTFSPSEAEQFINSISKGDIEDPVSFEEQALKFVGEDIYRAFFYGYTKKQWGIEPSSLPASILKRLPLRFNYDDNYFSHKYQGIPKEGYTHVVEQILKHQNIEVRLECAFEHLDEQFEHVFYSGPIDRFFDYQAGELGYRTLDFQKNVSELPDFQGCAVMNYGDIEVPWTRITEHKHFAPWSTQGTTGTIYFHEYSRTASRHDIPYYPIRLIDEKKVLSDYIEIAENSKNVTFVGRLGTYRYLDMDETIHRALQTAQTALDCIKSGKTLPVFVHHPLY